jgi:hypothetical protein
MRLLNALLISIVVTLPARTDAQSHGAHAATHEDSAFRAMQARGKAVMGVDQYTSVHRFDPLPDGGVIELQRDRDDAAGTAAIRAHIRAIARAFTAGDFTAPAAVHLETVPGVPELRARRHTIRYETQDRPRGAVLRIHTRDAVALKAVHRFLDYQRREHRTTTRAAHAH